MLTLCGSGLLGADAGQSSVAEIQNKMLSSAEKEVVALAEAMPADKYNFAPTQGAFTGVRTFSQQMSHIGTVLYMFSSVLTGEKMSVSAGTNENGPQLDGKDAVVKYLKDAFAYSHKSIGTLTGANFTETVTMSWGKIARGALAGECVSHTLDHYGQAVVYARMNDIIPPASRK